jgi:inhibitor of the pro-sigma K processing machinery
VKLKLDGQVVTYLALLGILLGIVIMLKIKNGIMIKILFRIIVGGGAILLFNYFISFFNISGKLPFNIFSVLTAALLEIPGFVLLIIIKYIIYP